MTLSEFMASLDAETPPARLGDELRALWWAARSDWNRAHDIVQNGHGRSAAWVHAYLHRVEGDLGNAGYWYARAGKPAASGALDEEWMVIAEALLVGAGV